LILSLGLAIHPADAAFELIPTGPRSAGLGGAGVALTGDSWGSLRNPALCAISRCGAGFFWSQEFGLPELSREAAVGIGSVRGQAFLIQASNLGGDLYREGEFGLTVGRRLRSDLAVGISVDGKWLDIKGYPTASLFTISGGIWTEPLDAVSLGAVWRQANEPKIPGYEGNLESSLIVGSAVEVMPGALLVADIVQEQHFRAEFRVGAEAQVLKTLKLRIGTRAEPVRPAAGFELSTGRWTFHYAGDLHPDLGPSHHVGLEFRLGR
jgi:hypothetical protein